MRGVESMREKEGREECKERREMQKEKKKSEELAPPSWKGNSTQPGGRFLPLEFGFYDFPLWLLLFHHRIA